MPESWGQQLWIAPAGHESTVVRIFHVTPAAGISEGAVVAAGQPFGTHASGDTMSDVAVEVHDAGGGRRLRSYFDLVSDEVFARYRARGVPDRDAMIVSAADRDADPLGCSPDGAFTAAGHLDSWVPLSRP